MAFAVAFLLVMLMISTVAGLLTLLLMLNLRVIVIEETDHWLNKLVLFQKEHMEVITDFRILSSAYIVGLDPTDETSWVKSIIEQVWEKDNGEGMSLEINRPSQMPRSGDTSFLIESM